MKRLTEDDSSIWFDDLEEMKTEYEKIKELLFREIPPGMKDQTECVAEQLFGYFVKLRKQTDTWGRKMLLKPNRKYRTRRFWQTHLYVLHDFLGKMTAVNMLDMQEQM